MLFTNNLHRKISSSFEKQIPHIWKVLEEMFFMEL